MERRIAIVAVMLAALACQQVFAAPPDNASAAATPADIRQACQKCLADLDHADYFARRQAADRLRGLFANPATAHLAADEIAAHWQSGELSTEARAVLRPLVAMLPATRQDGPAEQAQPQAELLVEQSISSDFKVRTAAEQQLKTALQSADCIAALRVELRRRLADPELPPADRTALAEAWGRVRAAWLRHDCPTDDAGPTTEQVATWLELLAGPQPAAGDATAWTAREAASRELLDALAHDSWAEPLQSMLTRQLSDARLNADSRRRLESLLERTQPVLVAEYWEGGRNLSLQYLYVNVPTTPEHGLRPTHFDLVDDRTAHCVSGNSLAPGDHPVGMLFPHPRQSGAQFRLVNLPTPRRRMRFELEVLRPDAERWSIASRQTLDRILEQNRPLTNDELRMVVDLDVAALSRFVGPYFQQVDDGHFLTAEQAEIGSHPRYGNLGRLSRHNALCLILTQHGTSEAIPGIMQALETQRIERPSPRARFHLPMIAAFSIARREPKQEIDNWLAGLLDRTDPLIVDQASSSQIGATAAAILLRQHGATPEAFGLTTATAELTDDLEWVGYRYRSADQPGRVSDWWRGKSAQKPAAARSIAR